MIFNGLMATQEVSSDEMAHSQHCVVWHYLVGSRQVESGNMAQQSDGLCMHQICNRGSEDSKLMQAHSFSLQMLLEETDEVSWSLLL